MKFAKILVDKNGEEILVRITSDEKGPAVVFTWMTGFYIIDCPILLEDSQSGYDAMHEAFNRTDAELLTIVDLLKKSLKENKDV